MRILSIIAGIFGLVMFTILGSYVIPYVAAFNGFMLFVIIAFALVQAVWGKHKD